MKLQELRNKSIIEKTNGVIIMDTLGRFTLFEYPNFKDFIKDNKYDNKDVSDFTINQKNILIIFVYEF